MKCALVLCLIAASAAKAYSQSPKFTELRPLSEYMALPEAQREKSYPFVRCAGLFTGHSEYAGANYDREFIERVRLSVMQLGAVATMFRASKQPNADLEKVATTINAERIRIADLYILRFKNNYAVSGEAFGSDQAVVDDLSICKDFALFAASMSE